MSKEIKIRLVENRRQSLVSIDSFYGDEKEAVDILMKGLSIFEEFFIDYFRDDRNFIVSIRYNKEGDDKGSFFSQCRYTKEFFTQTPEDLVLQELRENHFEYIRQEKER